MSRPKRLIARSHVEVAIDEPLLAKVQIELYDGAKGRVPRGALSELINALFREWLEKRGIK